MPYSNSNFGEVSDALNKSLYSKEDFLSSVIPPPGYKLLVDNNGNYIIDNDGKYLIQVD